MTCGPGEGTQIRYRSCTDPAPLLDGDECVGVTNQTQVCGEICPIGKQDVQGTVAAVEP